MRGSSQIASSKPYGYAVDWWSYGVTLYKLLYGVLPFTSTTESVYYQIKYQPIFLFKRFFGHLDKDLVYHVSMI